MKEEFLTYKYDPISKNISFFTPFQLIKVRLVSCINFKTIVPWFVRYKTVFNTSGKINFPENGAITCFNVSPVKIPPVWNVRIVNCVPGSPIDCAAIIPTASPNAIDFL